MPKKKNVMPSSKITETTFKKAFEEPEDALTELLKYRVEKAKDEKNNLVSVVESHIEELCDKFYFNYEVTGKEYESAIIKILKEVLKVSEGIRVLRKKIKAVIKGIDINKDSRLELTRWTRGIINYIAKSRVTLPEGYLIQDALDAKEEEDKYDGKEKSTEVLGTRKDRKKIEEKKEKITQSANKRTNRKSNTSSRIRKGAVGNENRPKQSGNDGRKTSVKRRSTKPKTKNRKH